MTEVSAIGFEPVASRYQRNFSPGELAARRRRVADEIGGDAIAVLQGAPSPKGFRLFRQSNDFYYLCGVEVPHSYLVIDGRSGRSTIYLPHRDPTLGHSDEPYLAPEDGDLALSSTGADAVSPLEALAVDLQRFVLSRGGLACWTPQAPAEQEAASRDQLLRAVATASADGWALAGTPEGHFVRLLGSRFPQLQVHDLSPTLDRLRLVKSEREIELLRVAGRLSALAVTEAMRSSAPGVTEYELGAIARLCFETGGARGEGYRGIVATGHNAWFGHYARQGGALAAGELVLMDYAPDVAYYTSDIGRMWPVSGSFSPQQRLLYGLMVDYHKELLKRIVPGVSADEVMDGAAGAMRKQIESTDFPEPFFEAAAHSALHFHGHMSHPVGMAVHDVGNYYGKPLTPGIVLSVDPMVRVPELGLYVRVEDTVVVNKSGIENLTAAAPLDAADVEATMKEEGILQTIRRMRPDWLSPARGAPGDPS